MRDLLVSQERMQRQSAIDCVRRARELLAGIETSMERGDLVTSAEFRGVAGHVLEAAERQARADAMRDARALIAVKVEPMPVVSAEPVTPRGPQYAAVVSVRVEDVKP